MCLSRVNEDTFVDANKEIIAYKVFINNGRNIFFPFQKQNDNASDRRCARGEWLRATDELITYLDIKDKVLGYPSGFHCYTTYEDARASWIRGCIESGYRGYDTAQVVAVKVRKIVVAGEEDCLPVIVAKEMYVPKKVEESND